MYKEPYTLEDSGLVATFLAAAQPCAAASRPVSRVLMVGGLVGNPTLSDDDQTYLKVIFANMAKWGARPAADLTIQVMNLRYGQDFLEKPVQTDLVVGARIYWSENQSTAHFIDRRMGLQSRKSQDPEAWHKALCASGAWLAVNVHNNLAELPTAYWEKPPFVRAGPPVIHVGHYMYSPYERIYDALVRT